MSPQEQTLNIAVVEDNDTLRDLLVSYLQQPGRRVLAADCGEVLNELLARHTLHILVLDVNLPYEDGLSIAQRLRRSHPQIKIIMLTARVRALERTEGYSAGADVYLTKPTNVAELEAVVQNLAQRMNVVATPVGYWLNRSSNVLTSPERKQLVLSYNETIILEQIALSSESKIDAEYLLSQLCRQSNAQMTRENLVVTISRLRKRLESTFDGEIMLQTVRNYGYSLNQPLTLI